MANELCSLFFLLILFSSSTAKSTAAKTPCDNCYHHSKAAYYYSKASALSSGACGYGSLALNYYGGRIAAASPSLFKDGAYCGACFQVRCMNKALCSEKGTTVVITDLHKQKNNSTDLVLGSRAFKSMANNGMDFKLLKLGLVDVEFKRIPCEYKSKNLAVRVEENSKYPDNLAFTVLFQGGQTEIKIIEVAQVGSSNWSGMDRIHGAVWNTTRALNGPLQLRFVVTMGYDAKYIWAQHALPAQWKPGSIYETDVQIDDVNIGGCYPCEPSRLK